MFLSVVPANGYEILFPLSSKQYCKQNLAKNQPHIMHRIVLVIILDQPRTKRSSRNNNAMKTSLAMLGVMTLIPAVAEGRSIPLGGGSEFVPKHGHLLAGAGRGLYASGGES